MSEAQVHHWTASDGIELAYYEVGQGRPVLLLHGLFSDAQMNWIKFGHAERIAAEGFRVIMLDHRAHGLSGKPHEPAHYPKGILARDLRELIGHLELEEFDLVGFSLGSRTVVQAVGEGLRPRKAVLAGMGLNGVLRWDVRERFFTEAIEMFDTAPRGDPHWLSIQFMRTMKVDLEATKLLLGTFGNAPLEWLEAFTMPTLVLIGTEDDANGSAHDLAAAIRNASFAEVPGTHMSSVTKTAMGEEIARFLAAA